MKALVYEGPSKVTLRDMPKPKAGRGQVLIETKAVGICGSDLGIYKGEFPNINPPLIIGHEGGGIVRDVGHGVTTLKEGDRVAVSPILYCGRCEFCHQGRYSLCDDLQTMGMIGAHGEYAEYFAAREQNCHVLPDSLPWTTAGLIDTLAGPILAMSRMDLPLGGSVAIFGPGPAGLFFSRLSKLSGASEVYLVGTREERLKHGPTYGADVTINVHKENTTQKIRELTRGRGVDRVIEAAGSEQALSDAVAVLRKGGLILLYGVYDTAPLPVLMQRFVLDELSCFGIADNTAGYPLAIKLLSNGTVLVDPILTHKLTLEELPQAFSSGLIEKRLEGYIKGVVVFE